MGQDDSTALMDAVVMINGNLTLDRVPIPTPGPGEVLVKTLAAGICGSDLHCATHGEQLIASAKEVAGVELFRLDEPVVMGHEYCAELIAYGPDTARTIPLGSRVASAAPVILRDPPVTVGFGGPDTPGAYAEFMVLTEAFLVPIPENLSDEVAVLAEPLGVALHAVNRGELTPHHVPLVIGCGPIGLAVIAILKARGQGPIVASDFSRLVGSSPEPSGQMSWSTRASPRRTTRGARLPRPTIRLWWGVRRRCSPRPSVPASCSSVSGYLE